MNISYFTAVSAMNAFQKDLDVTANNMANVSTNGYKSMHSSFDDLLYTRMDMRPQAQVGHGVKNDGPGTVFQQGIFRKTDRKLDFAISGNAFFAIQTSEDEEEPAYTRSISSRKMAGTARPESWTWIIWQSRSACLCARIPKG